MSKIVSTLRVMFFKKDSGGARNTQRGGSVRKGGRSYMLFGSKEKKKAQSSVRKKRGESGRLEGLPRVAKRSSCNGDRQGAQRTRSYFRYW